MEHNVGPIVDVIQITPGVEASVPVDVFQLEVLQVLKLTMYFSLFLTHPCSRRLLKIFFISNDRGRSLFEAFDWLFICVDPSDVRDLRVKVVVEIEMP